MRLNVNQFHKICFAFGLLLISLLIGFLTSCGGGGDAPPPPTSDITQGIVVVQLADKEVPVSDLIYETSPSGQRGRTSATGEFTYKAGDTVTFRIDRDSYTFTIAEKITQFTQNQSGLTSSQWESILVNKDSDADPDNGIQIFNRILQGRLLMNYQGNQVPVSLVNYTSIPGSENGSTDENGIFYYVDGDSVSFTIGQSILSTTGNDPIYIDKIPTEADHQTHLMQVLLLADDDQTPSNGIQATNLLSGISVTTDNNTFLEQYYKGTGSMPVQLFSPSLGINLEAPQAEADTAGQALPFVDLFRTARPFPELSIGETLAFDENGWPSNVTTADQFIRTKMLQGVPSGAIPNGDYTLIYEGDGLVEFSGSIIKEAKPFNPGNGLKGNTLSLELTNSNDPEANSLALLIRGDRSDVRNIRLIMPGGACRDEISGEYNPFIRITNADNCPVGTEYVSYIDRLINNRNDIIFNPDYLQLLRNFHTLRMMNFMEASPGRTLCFDEDLGELDQECIDRPILWSARPTLDDAVWGGSGRTPHDLRQGVPVEVMVLLSNTLNTHPWFNMPHSADDDYISNFATLVHNQLNDNLKPHIEYSNETWNPGFLGFHYVQARGIEAGLNTVPSAFEGTARDANYFARLRYFSRRSVEIFNLWENTFTDSSRIVSILGSFQGDTVLSDQLLTFENAKDRTDAIAIAPYFSGCIDRTGSCATAQKVFSEISTVDDVFDIIDQLFENDPSGLEATKVKIDRHISIATSHNVQLFSYEGGQHLTIMGNLGSLSETRKEELRTLFRGANRDFRMKVRYLELLNHWKQQQANGAGLFTLYTNPQTFYRFGNWGIKEHLGKTRSESPKYDASLEFQEETIQCWWNNCQ